MIIVCVALFLGYCLLIWLNTDAFIEYMNLLHIPFFKKQQYLELKEQGYAGNYISFLSEYYSDFFMVRLLACPICISVWLSIFFCFVFGVVSLLLLGPLTLFFYLVFNKLM